MAHCRQPDAAETVRQQLERIGCCGLLDHCTDRDLAAKRHEVHISNCEGMVILYDPQELPWAEERAYEAFNRVRLRCVAAIATSPLGGKSFGVHYDRLISLEAAPNGRLDALDKFVTTLTESDNG